MANRDARDDAAGAKLVPADRANSYVLRLDGHDQSYVDLDDPTRLVFDYVRRMGDVLDTLGTPGAALRVAHVGGAAMTLPRYVAATRPRSTQVVLEPAEALTALVRAELPLPARSGIKVRPLDGRSGLVGLRDGAFDAVVVDAYAKGQVPADLVTVEAVAEIARVLTPEGLVLFNLSDRAPFAWTRRVIAAVRTQLPRVMVSAEPATLRARRGGNLLLVASRSGLPESALLERAARSASPYKVLGAAAVSDALGGGNAFTDADTEASPRP
ncbi:spermidine synthase [Nocardioides gilvus]|uniref:spermidine synthase n=1 Tax=Nocardioides gilvus TaxID=1735589 RepID=UPI00194F9442|nr:fused MFS/spermidine synthase [Nocardioides gilvus]